ncbi:unnamed protein product, partial [Mesorhabditis belari]|uniref:Uncharacterized protein n=1 Tax=Mesorhabditis belari TaxID=2138241 RepID=A0AAF3FC92_9BILA
MTMEKLISYFLLVILCSIPITAASDEEFFLRSAKWAKLAPSGGSLVSGRGNFRPGFADRSWRSAIYEPTFTLRKRSGPVRIISAAEPLY